MVNNQLSITYSHIINLNKKYSLSFALQPTLVNKRLDYNRFIFGDQLDLTTDVLKVTQEKIPRESIHFLDISSGLLLYSEDLFLGLSVYHISQPNESFTSQYNKLPIRFGFNFGYNILFNGRNKYRQNITLTPSVLIRYQRFKGVKTDFTQYNLGATINYGLFLFGTYCRFGDSMIHSIGLKYKKIRFGYSFDYSINDYNNNTSHETSLILLLPCKTKKRKFRALSCPSF